MQSLCSKFDDVREVNSGNPGFRSLSDNLTDFSVKIGQSWDQIRDLISLGDRFISRKIAHRDENSQLRADPVSN